MDTESLLGLYNIGIPAPLNLQELLQKMPDVFVEKPILPLNLQQIFEFYSGDSAIENEMKYKNIYKKVFNPKQIISPFTASQILPDDKTWDWCYLDGEDRIQGPFNSVVMDNWYNLGQLPMDLLVGLKDREKFVKLSDFINSTYPFNKNPEIYHTKKFYNDMISQYEISNVGPALT